MSQTHVLDTSALLNLIRGKELGQQIDQAFGLRAAMHRQTVSIVTHGELRVLADRRNWGADKKAALDVALENLVTVNLDSDAIVRAYVEVERTCRMAPGGERRMGRMICGSPPRLSSAIFH